jgi:hypothetical protein
MISWSAWSVAVAGTGGSLTLGSFIFWFDFTEDDDDEDDDDDDEEEEEEEEEE